MNLRRSLLSFVFGVIFTSSVIAGTVNAPGPSIPVPPGTWVKVLTRDFPAQTNDWEQLVYVGPLQRSVMLSQYHQNNSEPNESIVGYNFDTNSWDLLDMGGLFHTENMPEGGESEGYFDYNPNNGTIEYHCCTSGSNQAENVNHTWWFDVLGQSGRDEQTPIEPLSLQPGGAFDVAHNVAVMFGGASYVGTWIYDPVANSWQPKTPLGTPPDPSVILPGMTYSSAAQQVFLYGGRNGAGTYYSDLYYYDVPSNTWTLVSPAGGIKPPGRCCTNFAYDSTNNIFLLYGGKNASGVLGDTWAYDPVANMWTQLNPPVSPVVGSVSDFTRLAYDADHNVFVLAHLGTGGYFGGSWTTLPFQTWLFRYAGTGPNAASLLNSTQSAPGSLNRNLQSWAKDPALAASGNSLYVSWSETGSPFVAGQAAWPHIFADQYSGGNWSNLGGTYSSISGATYEAHAPSLAVIGGTPWISWYQNVNRVPQIYAASWNGTGWQGGPIGLVGTSSVQGRSTLTQVAGTLYIGFVEVNKSVSPQSAYAYVKSWNGKSWSLVGSGALNVRPAAGSTATSISIATDGVNPYAAWTEYFRTTSAPGGGGVSATNPQAYVSYWNGNQWTAVGGSLNVSAAGWANDVSIAYFGGQPYAAWTERTQTGNNQLYVATWNGAAWTLTESGSLNQGGANGWAYHPSLVADPTGTNLYLAWVEQTALGRKAQVFVTQFASGSWSLLGQPLNVDPVNGSAQRVSLGVLNGQPVAAWSEVNLGSVREIYASQWNGSAWVQLPGNVVKDTTAPTKPASLTATAVSASQIKLAWTPSTDTVGVNGYYIYRNGTQAANVTSTLSYQDTGLNPSIAYSYTVAAYDAAGNISVQSPKATATTLSGSPNPAVSFNSPSSGATVSGTVTVSANATDNVGIANVQFQVDGANFGSPVTSGPPYSMSLNTTTFTNGSHTLTAIATDTLGLTATCSESVTISNSTTVLEPEISGISASAITSSGASIAWTTDEASTSQVQYGTTPAYGSSTSVNTTLVSSHSVQLTGLQASTTYHYAVFSQDGSGNLNSSGDNLFTTSAPGLQTFLQIQGIASEVIGVINGSTVTPTTAPAGFTGTVVAKGKGAVNFVPSNGVYFLNCCTNANDAYFKFGGATIGNIFNANQGQISFSLQSRYTYAQRKASASLPRYAFDARDGNGKHQFYFLTEVTSQGLEFSYLVGSAVHNYFVPSGTEDALFGNGVTMQVTISWGAPASTLYLNGVPVQSASYAAPTPNWSSASNLDLGAFEYSTYGGYNVSDDVILNFTVAGP
jgi:chitodextrinase